MKSDNNISIEYILNEFKDEKAMNQIKNLGKQLIIFDLREKEKNMNMKDPQIIKGVEQIIFSIISNNILEKEKYFTELKDNTFNYELFIYILMELIKSKITSIYKNSKIFGPSFFKEKNTIIIKKKQSMILNFLLSFNDNRNINELELEQIAIMENKEESFLIYCVKIIVILNNYVENNIIKGIFDQFKTKENKKIINKLCSYLIKILYIFIRIKKYKNLFKENNEIIYYNKKVHCNFDIFEKILYKIYENNMPSLIILLFDIIFKYDLISFFNIIINKDDISIILINKLCYEHKIRYRFLELINNSPSILGEIEQKELLKILDINNTIMILFNYIMDDINCEKYNNDEYLSKLLDEIKILYLFSILINSKDSNIENIIINILKKIILKTQKDKIIIILENIINKFFKLGKKIPKYKYKIYNFIFLISESIPDFRNIILKLFFINIKGNLNEYKKIKENMNSFNSFINNLYNYEGETISIFFDFLQSLKEKGFFPINETIQILEEIPFINNISKAKYLVESLNKFLDIKRDNINIFDGDIKILSFSKNKNLSESEKIDDNFNEFRFKIYENYLNILYNLINELKDNINNIKNKSPFDIDVTLSSIINTNYSCINEETNKKYISFDILLYFINYLSIILKDEKIFQLFISKKFLELFPYLINDEQYKIISYKLIKIFFESKVNNEKYKDKNNQQILNILNRFKSFSKIYKNDEINKLKEILLIMDSIKIIFSKKSLISIEFITKIYDFYYLYSEFICDNYKTCYNNYNLDYHILIKNYLDIIFELIINSNKNIIIKNNNYFPINNKNIKCLFENIIKFYAISTKENELMNKYFLNIIKYFIDKSLYLYISSKENIEFNNENNLNDKDFCFYYINKYKIDNEILKEKNEINNNNFISNFFIHSPFILLLLLKLLFKYNKYVNQYLKFLYFLCKLNQQNIIFLLKHKFLKICFNILKENSNYNEIILKLFKESFLYLEEKDFYYCFVQILNILNDSKDNKIKKNLIKELIQLFIKDLQIINDSNNEFFKGIILSNNKIEQMNIYNLIEIKKLYLKNEKEELNNLYIKQEIYFYNSLKTKKLLLLRISNNDIYETNINKKIKNEYIEISYRNEEINISENSEKMKYEDLSNYNSIFIDDNLEKKQENYLKLNEKNIIKYLFKNDKKILIIYINEHKIISYKYNYIFNEMINIEIGYPLDLIKEEQNNEFKLYNHIKLKSFFIFSENKNNIEKIYKLSLDNITCNYIFPDELTNFKLDENTYLISKYNNIKSVLLNNIFKNSFIKNQFYKKCFFNQILSSNSFNYFSRIDKYIFIILNDSNIDKYIFNELIHLLCIYLIINKSFINKFFSKDEFSCTLYFSIYKNSKFIDKNTIENLLSIILVNKNNNNLIIDILLDLKIYEIMNSQTKIDLLNILNENFIEKNNNNINKSYIIEKLQILLILCISNNKIIDELIINITFKYLEQNEKEKKIINILEELIYILFHFSQFNYAHLSKYKNGKEEKTTKIIYEYFHKIYNNEAINNLKDYILKKIEKIYIDIEIKDKLYRLINTYSPQNKTESSIINNNNIYKEDTDDDLYSLFDLPKNIKEIKRSHSFTDNKKKYYYFNRENNNFIEKNFDKQFSINEMNINNILKKGKNNKTILNNASLKIEQIREPSIIPLNEVIIIKGVIKGKSRKTYNNIYKKKALKKKVEIEIKITEKDIEKCNNDCHLCLFIQKILLLMYKREKKYEIYKNYLLHSIKELLIINKKKNLNLEYKFSYYLMMREGPNRIRKRFNIRIDKLLNNEYDKDCIKKIKIENNKYWNLFDFYENKEKGEYISYNLLNFFSLGQIYNINIIQNLVDEDDTFQECFNCLLFKGLSYLDSVLILGLKKIYIITRVNISQNNILYDAHFPINKKFWILNHYEDILTEQCEYLNSYENKNKKGKKKKFEKIEKGFWIYSFYYIEINEIHKRKYLHQNNSLEIFLKNGKNYYIAFNMNKRDKLFKLIIENIKLSHNSINNAFIINNKFNDLGGKETQKEKIDNIIFEIQNESLVKNDNIIFITEPNLFIEDSKKYKIDNYLKNIFKKQKKLKYNLGSIIDIKSILEQSYEQWTLGHFSNYSYLMLLNTVSGRTYNDLAQYPVYPWILSDFSSKKLDYNNPNIYRDFKYPIYAQTEENRENLAIKYENLEGIEEHNYFSGSHYSNAGFVCYYLIRIKPFSISAAEIQGEYFDTTDRLFWNIENLAQLNEKYQELIPELFNIPEIYININNLNFGINSEKKNIDNVLIPSWGKYSPRLFCKIMKKSLENQNVSININNWIDLIFGYKQKGIQAEKFYNVLREVCTKFDPEKEYEDEKEMDIKINEMIEMGINPRQLFFKPHRKREKHQKIKAFFCRNIYLQYFKAENETYILKNIENNDNIKEMNQYYEYPNKYLSKGEGGLSSFRLLYEKNNEENKNNNLIYFIISGKKTLIPPSYKNYIQWNDNNCFYLVNYFKKLKYKFEIYHMKRYKIECIKITKDGNFIIIGYNNGIIEKYKLNKIYGPKIEKEKEKEKINENIFNNNIILENNNKNENESINIKKGLFNVLFGSRNKRRSTNIQFYKNINIKDEENDEEDKNKIKEIENEIYKYNIKNSIISNNIIFDTQILISASNIINSDCILLNNNTGKFIQYSGYLMNNEEINKEDNTGYAIYYHHNNKQSFTNKDNVNNNLEKYYIIFLVNSSNLIFEEISMIEICESYSFILIIDKENYLFILDLNTFDIIKKINCNIYINEKIKYISICPITGDFILASNYQIILMSINGVLITKMSNIDNKINFCFIKTINNSDLYLFTAHENGNIIISQLINNISGIIFDANKYKNKLLNSFAIFELNNKYDPIKIKNITEAYYNAYDSSYNKSFQIKEYKKYIEDANNFSLIFDTITEIKCSEFPLKYIKLSKDSSNLICIDINNNIINLNYDDFFLSKQKFKDKKKIIYCNKCKKPINSFKIFCQICGKKLCPNCKIEMIIPEISLKNTKPICDECFQIKV